MRLLLQGHDYRYAAEQMLLTLFPNERPVYQEPDENEVRLSLHRGKTWITAGAVLHWQGKTARHSARIPAAQLTGDTREDDRLCQRAIKTAFYRCGVDLLGHELPWGATTGVRPVKIPARLMAKGATAAQARQTLCKVYHVAPERAELAVECARVSLGIQASLDSKDISLYVGIPFCPTRCAYCSFVSADVRRTLKLTQPYTEALIREIRAAGEGVREAGKTVRSVYFGGGTPTTLTPGQLDLILGALEQSFDLGRCLEYTVEAGRPDTITEEKLRVLASHRVSRLSVNPQTMENPVLQAMGRCHTAQQTEQAYNLVRRTGSFVVNMDLIAGLPNDTPEGFRRSLERVVGLNPENITVHTLAMKRGSTLRGNREVVLPDPEQVEAMLSFTWTLLRQNGYRPYYLYRQKYMTGAFENVGWCKPGKLSYYNVCMMEELQSILSLGAGGSTKLIDSDQGSLARYTNPKYPQDYLARIDRICREKRQLPWNGGGTQQS